MDNIITKTVITSDEYMPVRDLYIELPNLGTIKLARLYLEGFQDAESLDMLPELMVRIAIATSKCI